MKHVGVIQDISCYGRCSMTIALPVLSSARLQTTILPTMLLSMPTGECFEPFKVDISKATQKVVQDLRKRKISFDYLYSGYLGSEEAISLALELFKLYPNSYKIVDPAFADQGKIYSNLSISYVEKLKEMIALADLITPNVSELCILCTGKYQDIKYKETNIKDLCKLATSFTHADILVTSAMIETTTIGSVLYQQKLNELFLYTHPYIATYYPGSGDLFTSLYLGLIANGSTKQFAIQKASDYVLSAILNSEQDSSVIKSIAFESILADYAYEIKKMKEN